MEGYAGGAIEGWISCKNLMQNKTKQKTKQTNKKRKETKEKHKRKKHCIGLNLSAIHNKLHGCLSP